MHSGTTKEVTLGRWGDSQEIKLDIRKWNGHTVGCGISLTEEEVRDLRCILDTIYNIQSILAKWSMKITSKNLRKETTKEERIDKKERKFDKLPSVRIMKLTKQNRGGPHELHWKVLLPQHGREVSCSRRAGMAASNVRALQARVSVWAAARTGAGVEELLCCYGGGLPAAPRGVWQAPDHLRVCSSAAPPRRLRGG